MVLQVGEEDVDLAQSFGHPVLVLLLPGQVVLLPPLLPLTNAAATRTLVKRFLKSTVWWWSW